LTEPTCLGNAAAVVLVLVLGVADAECLSEYGSNI